MRYEASDWDRALTALRDASSIAIACHVNPDGDALGSLLGASLGLKKLGKKTWPALEGGTGGVPPAYSFLPGIDTLVEPKELGEFDLFLALDCGAGDRLGPLQEAAKSAAVTINVDHHPGNDLFGTLNVVVVEASSTAELIARLLLDAGVAIDRDIATCLYVGLVTDTGRFQYSNTTPETLRIAADLLEFGVPATSIAQEVFESSPFGYLKLVGKVLDRARLFEEDGFVYSWVTLTDLDEAGVGMDETENLVDAVRSTRAADVAAMFKELPEGGYRVSLRSKGPRSVGAIARELGGGGHELAAGFSAKDIDDTVAAVRRALAAM